MMKRIIVMLLLSCAVAMGAGIKWEKEYASALKQAKAVNKPLMFIISNHNCRFCVLFENTTLKDPKVIKKLNADYVNLLVFTDENPVYPSQLSVDGTPSTWFLKPDGEPMFQPIMGAVDAGSFLNALDQVKKEHVKNASKK